SFPLALTAPFDPVRFTVGFLSVGLTGSTTKPSCHKLIVSRSFPLRNFIKTNCLIFCRLITIFRVYFADIAEHQFSIGSPSPVPSFRREQVGMITRNVLNPMLLPGVKPFLRTV